MPYHSGNHLVDPQLLFEKIQLRSGMHVADLGCGRTGHIVFPASKILGERGLVYAVDVLKEVLETIGKRAATSAIHNVHTVWSDVEQYGKTAIPDKSLDAAFYVNTLVQTDDHVTPLKEAARLLKDKARLLVVDWSMEGLPFGPEDGRFIDFDKILEWAKKNNFALQEDFSVGKYHRGLVFFRQE